MLSLLKGVKIQYLSDIHLDVNRWTKYRFAKKGNILMLPGDIGDPIKHEYHKFLEHQAYRFKAVYFVAGNHEYYSKNKTICEINEYIKDLTKYINKKTVKNNLYFLNRDVSTINNDYVVLGCTLWTNIPKTYPNSFDNKNILNDDFKLITNEQISDINKQDIEWLNEQIDYYKDKDRHVIIMTHHCPTKQLQANKYKTYMYPDKYYNSLDYLMKKPVVAWLSGHSHCIKNIRVNNVYCGIYAVGYNNEIIKQTL